MNDFQEIYAELKSSKLHKIFDNSVVLITGANGFLGKLYQQLLKYMTRKGHIIEVVCMDNYIVGGTENKFVVDGFTYISHDICQTITSEVLRVRPNIVINCAGIASPKYYKRYPLKTIEVSVHGTMNIMEFVNNTSAKILNFSSSEIYGNPSAVPTPETYFGQLNPLSDRSPYDCGKMMVETITKVYQDKGVDAEILRPFNVFGYNTINDGRVMNNMIDKALNEKHIQVYGDGDQTRTFCWFTDFLIGSIYVLDNGDGLPYNIGNDENEISMFALAEIVKKVTKNKKQIERIEKPKVYEDEPMRRCPDLTRIKNLGYSPAIDIEEGIRRLVKWKKYV